MPRKPGAHLPSIGERNTIIAGGAVRAYVALLVLVASAVLSACDTAKEKGPEAATIASKAATELARTGKWLIPMKGATEGPWQPGDGDHVGRDEHAIDYLPGESLDVYPMADGVVAWAGSNCQKRPEQAYCYGNTLVVEHGEGLYSMYTHLQDPPDLNPGDKVSRTQRVGAAGNSGCDDCPAHVHFVVRRGTAGLRDNSVLFANANEAVDARSRMVPR